MALTTSGVATALARGKRSKSDVDIKTNRFVTNAGRALMRLAFWPQSPTRISTRPNGRSSIRWRTASAALESGNTLAMVGRIAPSDR
jgi:hypothetical protein